MHPHQSAIEWISKNRKCDAGEEHYHVAEVSAEVSPIWRQLLWMRSE